MTLPRALAHFCCLACSFLCDQASAETRPNFLIVLADDLGYGDLGCYGNETVRTPHLDRFAAEGMRFTDCYAAAANCSPSRAGLLTGRHPWRLGIHNWIPMLSPMHLQESERTLASLLREAGYDTCHVGKWHLNGMFALPGQPQPGDHGFDHWFSTQNNALPNHRNPWNFVRNGVPVGEIEGYSAEIVADEAVKWLSEGREDDRPFFLFVCFHEPHEPVATAAKYERLHAGLEDPSERALWGNIAQMDAGFGRLMGALDSFGLAEDTVVFFTSDNGPALTGKHPYGSAGPLRAKKGYLYEGGIRVPGLLRWPGRTEAGSVEDVPVSSLDLVPTLSAAAGISLPDDRAYDGVDWSPMLGGEELDREKALFWYFLRARGKPKAALRDGPWKIVAGIDLPDLQPDGGITEEDRRYAREARLSDFALYRLDEKSAESEDLSASEPEIFDRMKVLLESAVGEVRGESPAWPVWEFPRYEAQRIVWPDYQPLRKPPVDEP